MYKMQEKILKEFGKYAVVNSEGAFDDERCYGCGWWFYTKDPYTYDGDCHTFHEDTLSELSYAIKEAAKLNDWSNR